MINNLIKKLENLNSISLLKIIPFAFALHEFEEWNVLQWHQKHQSNIPEVADIDLRTIFLLLILIVFIVFNLSLLLKNKKTTAYILLPFLGLMFYNGIVHFYWTIYFNEYSPGLIFGFFLGVPLTSITTYKLFKEGLLNKLYLTGFGLLYCALFIKVVRLGDKLEPAIVNAMLLGRELAQIIWF